MAREELYAALMAGGMHSPDRSDAASARIAAYRAEVLREAADAVADDRDTTIPSSGKGAYRRGMTRAVDLLRRMAAEGGESR